MNNYAQYLFNLENPTESLLDRSSEYCSLWFSDYFAAAQVAVPDSVKDEMLSASQILSRVRLLDPHAIIVGGAPRSWFFGQNANDIDIHFYMGEGRRITRGDTKRMLEGATGCTISIAEGCYLEESDDGPIGHPYMDCVYNMEHLGVKYQFIKLRRKTFGVIDTFTMNMAQIWSDGKNVTSNHCFNIGVFEKALVKVDHEHPSRVSFVDKYKEYFKNYRYFDTPTDFNVHMILTKKKPLSYNAFQPWEDATTENLAVLKDRISNVDLLSLARKVLT